MQKMQSKYGQKTCRNSILSTFNFFSLVLLHYLNLKSLSPTSVGGTTLRCNKESLGMTIRVCTHKIKCQCSSWWKQSIEMYTVLHNPWWCNGPTMKSLTSTNTIVKKFLCIVEIVAMSPNGQWILKAKFWRQFVTRLG